MNSLALQISNHSDGPVLFFLGQAGFVLKSSKGVLLGIDLYLSNCCERYYGFKRLMPYLLDPAELIFDYLIVTHSHEDHFDIDALPTMMSNGHTKLLVSQDAYQRSKELDFPMERTICLSRGKCYISSDIKIQAVFCDHGTAMPYALAVVIFMDGKSIYITGDTALRLDKVPEILKYAPFDIMICPINGKFGNMSEHEAVSLCGAVNPKMVIPCHYWNFAEHGGNPGIFVEGIKKQLPHQAYHIMAMGEKFIL